MVIIHQLEVWDSSPLPTVRPLQENPKASEKNKPRWYPQPAGTFYFYKSFCSVLGSQALETLQLGFRELNEPDLAWLLQPSPEPVETWLYTKASWNLLRNPLRNLLRNPVEPDLALHQSLPDLLRNLLRNLVEPNPAPAPMHTGAILGRRPH